ncbi:GNAT family N-acetyltransferase [Gordonia hydrophobica]|uniref:GNAT family N-acetyltransferase n=1 Tax=Gordonia hydrophobica TaxID=40516 RepID=A0ABZ2U5H2_9ACTN|nr:GNAT family N-acetyltransferase [Gordonia hydrophobica]MBM7368803.1 RimJ/RimL family protein N-acetyltransferase [Gordonia hydrophobica]
MPSARNPHAAKRLHFGETTLILVVVMLFTAASSALAYATKVGCTTPSEPGAKREWLYAHSGDIVPCYSDLMTMWHGRGLASHVFPYVHGGITPDGHLFGGVVEYPVLSGLLMWLSGLGADTDREFLWHNLLILAPFAFITAILLALLTRWWSLLWAATPPLMLYALHNWELPVVCAAVAGVAVMAWGGSADPTTGLRRWSVRTTAIIAAIPLGIGFSLKIYPGLFVLPLMLWVLTRGEATDQRRDPRRGARDWLGAGGVAVSAIATVVVTQAPFMIAGYEGWKAAIDFQTKREANLSTNSIWYWGLRMVTGGETPTYNSIVDVASPLLIILAFAVACFLGWRVYQRDGVFPWLGVSGAMLAGFMVFHKVHSPQYTLWILPFFILLRVRWPIIALYLLADTVLDLTIFHLLLNYSPTTHAWVIGGVVFGVWTHAVLLVVLIVHFVHAAPREPLASYLRGTVPPSGPLTRLAATDAADARTWLGAPTLVADGVTLRPLELSDAQDLGAVAGDAELYQWTSGVPHGTDEAIGWIQSALANPHRVAFAVIDADGQLVGSTSFYDVDAADQTLAIGYTFYGPAAMGTAVNPAAKLALCEYAFTVCDAVRVVWHTHASNTRSRAAITKLGALEEGELRKHRRFRDGWRTTAQFAIVDDDWPASRATLEARLAARK